MAGRSANTPSSLSSRWLSPGFSGGPGIHSGCGSSSEAHMVFLNGRILPIEDAKVSVLDRGFIFGDGVYELVPVYSRVPFRLEEHLLRLERSLAAVRIRNPYSPAQWREFIYRLIDASASNVFIVRRGVIESPPKGNLILPGITYDVIVELARANGMPLEFREVREAEVRGADELWVTSSSKEVLAIVMLDGKRIGDGQPGPVFRRMYQLYQEFKLKVMRAGKREAASV